MHIATGCRSIIFSALFAPIKSAFEPSSASSNDFDNISLHLNRGLSIHVRELIHTSWFSPVLGKSLAPPPSKAKRQDVNSPFGNY